MFSALAYLQFHSVKNRTVARLKRLRQPKYLVGAIVGGIYFYFYFFRYVFGGMGRGKGLPWAASTENQALYQALGGLFLLIFLLVAWLVPHQRAALAFTEAEIAFLFPAPVTRRGLIHYKLVRSQMAILFTTLLLMLVTNRLGGSFWTHAAGWWLILSTLNLHLLGSSFARTMLLDRGVSNKLRRLVLLAALLGVVVFVIAWAWRSLPPFTMSSDASQNPDEMVKNLKTYFQQVLTSGPVPWLLLPFRWVVRPYLAPDAVAFVQALPASLLLLVAHYWWVVRSDVAFEEASVEASRIVAEKVAAVRAGNWQAATAKNKVKRPPFVLRPGGPPAVAFLWKNLLSAGRAFTLRFWLMLLVLGVTLSVVVGQVSANAGVGAGLAMAAGMLLVWSVMLGPQILRHDFRQDLPLADVLKTYPLPGWQLALGELLAPAAILTGVQWVLLLVVCMLVSQFGFPGMRAQGAALNFAVGLSVAAVLPFFNLLTLQIPNAAVLLFPAWFLPGKEGAHGIEATGQRIIFLFGQILVLLLTLAPAGVVFGLVFFLARMIFGLLGAIPLAACAAALVLAGEAALGLMLLGFLFNRFNLSSELPA